MKKRLINAGILTAVFIVAVFVFSYLTNRDNNNMTADIGNASLPSVVFFCGDYEVNHLNPYVEKMDVSTMRDTITPVENGKLDMYINAYENKIKSVKYEVYTLDGEEKLAEDTQETDGEGNVTLHIDEELLTDEKLLLVTLDTADKETYYYTRIRSGENLFADHCLNYIGDFHENALGKVEDAGIEQSLKPSEDESYSYQEVTINSDYDYVVWGDLEPVVVGSERWQIVEANPAYISVLLEYEVRCKGEENEEDTYTVEEFFRVGMEYGVARLQDYHRTMDQIFNGSRQVLSENGIILGIAGEDVPYLVGNNGMQTAFVQAGELWNYDQDKDELSLLFSFRDSEDKDIRNMVDQHEIHLISMDKSGNVSFVVYGYMNRGSHEGEVGAAVYCYNKEKNSIDEKIFIPSNKSGAAAEEELSKLLYYSSGRDMLYALVNGTLYEIDMEKESETILAENLTEGQCVTSLCGSLAAYQTGGALGEAATVLVKNLESGEEYKVTAGEGESVQPLGFVNEDFVCGFVKTSDIGTTMSGAEVLPMYKVEIRGSDNKVARTYESDEEFVLSAEFAEGMVTLNRAKKSGGAFEAVTADQITSNEEKKESNISLSSYVTDLKGTQRMLTFEDGISDTKAKVLKPKQVLNEKDLPLLSDTSKAEQKFYAYGYGGLQGICKDAAEAVDLAKSVGGVATSSGQEIIWAEGLQSSKGAVSVSESILKDMEKRLKAGDSPLDVANGISGDKGIDLTGCSAGEALYFVSEGAPVIAAIDGKTTAILTEYNDDSIKYVDVASGKEKSITVSQLDSRMKKTGRVFVSALPFYVE